MTGLDWRDRLAGTLAFATCLAVIAAVPLLGARSFSVIWAAAVTLTALAYWRLG